MVWVFRQEGVDFGIHQALALAGVNSTLYASYSFCTRAVSTVA